MVVTGRRQSPVRPDIHPVVVTTTRNSFAALNDEEEQEEHDDKYGDKESITVQGGDTPDCNG